MTEEQPDYETYDDAMDEPVVNLQRQRDKRNLLLLGAFVLTTFFGVILYSFGGFQPEEAASDHVLDRLSPPPPKSRTVETDKYKNFSREMAGRGQPDANTLAALTEREVTTPKRSNESLGEADYREVRRATGPTTYAARSRSGTKEQLNQDFQRRNQAVQEQNRRYARVDTPIFQRTEAELQAERQAQEDRQLNRRTANLILEQLEQTNRNPAATGQPANLSGGLPADGQRTSSEDPPTTPPVTANSAQAVAQLVPQTARNTIATPGGNRFYTLTTAVKKEYYTDSEAIPAVIHGDADGIQVGNGSVVHIRLTQAVTLLSAGEQVALPVGTLLTGEARIQGERVQVTVNTVRIKNALYPISMTAYDLDGNRGLYLADAKNRQVVSRALAATTTGTLGGGGFFTGGSIGQQVGTRVATQGIQSAVRGVQQIARQRLTNPQVTIKSNYKILLKTEAQRQ